MSYYPKSCLFPFLTDIKRLKQLGCVEACNQLHEMGSLIDILEDADKYGNYAT